MANKLSSYRFFKDQFCYAGGGAGGGGGGLTCVCMNHCMIKTKRTGMKRSMKDIIININRCKCNTLIY